MSIIKNNLSYAKVTLSLAFTALLVACIGTSIVFSNLLRNAYQHTADGTIIIEVSNNSLTIKNPSLNSKDRVSVTHIDSFGLGLQLIARICEKLNWHFDYQDEKTTVSVAVTW